MTYDVKHTKELASFGFAVAKGLKATLADGEVTLFDALFFKEALAKSSAAFDGVALVDDELLDLSSAELDELEKFAIVELKALGLPEGDWLKYLKGAVLIGKGLLTILS